MKKFKVFETFSGIGAQHKALSNLSDKSILDYEIIGTSDWDVYAVAAYKAIHFPKHISDDDISEADLKKFFKQNVLSLDGKKPSSRMNNFSFNYKMQRIFDSFKKINNIGSIVDSYKRVKNELIDQNKGIDLLTYSFPCQDLSSAGNFHGFNEGIKKNTRSGLLLEIEKLLNKIFKNNPKDLPKYLLLENVLNLVQTKHKDSFDKWLKKLNQLGYKTIWGKINSHEYGMLQARRRVFALSIYDPNNKIPWSNNDGLDDVLQEIYKNEFQPKWIQKSSDVFDFTNSHAYESELCKIKDTPSRQKMIEWGLLIDENYKGKISTITTKQDRWPNAGYLEFKNNDPLYTNKRFITPRECYKLMGFDDSDYQNALEEMNDFCISEINAREKLYRQAGNSIAVNSLEMIFYLMNKIENGEQKW